MFKVRTYFNLYFFKSYQHLSVCVNNDLRLVVNGISLEVKDSEKQDTMARLLWIECHKCHFRRNVLVRLNSFCRCHNKCAVFIYVVEKNNRLKILLLSELKGEPVPESHLAMSHLLRSPSLRIWIRTSFNDWRSKSKFSASLVMEGQPFS